MMTQNRLVRDQLLIGERRHPSRRLRPSPVKETTITSRTEMEDQTKKRKKTDAPNMLFSSLNSCLKSSSYHLNERLSHHNNNNKHEEEDEDDNVDVDNMDTTTTTEHYCRNYNQNDGRLMLICAILALFYCLFGTFIQPTRAIKLQPEGREKFYWSGEQFVITCQNNNNIKNVKMRWIGPDGSQITEDRSQRVHAESTGPHGHRLVVMNATSAVDDGQYKCTLGSTDDRQPREHIEFNLKIFMTTNFKDTPNHLVLPAAQSGTLTCRVEFDPNVSSGSISWHRDQRPIDFFNDTQYQVIDYDSNKQYSQLIMTPVTKQNDGVYTCRAVAVTQQLSKISDFDIRLETNYGPIFDKEHETVWVERPHSMAQNRYLLMPPPFGTISASGSAISPLHYQSHHQSMLHPSMLFGAAAGAVAMTSLRQQQQQAYQPHSSSSMPPTSGSQQHPSQQHPHSNHMGRPRIGGGGSGRMRGRAYLPQEAYDETGTNGTLMVGNGTNAQIVRVELRCSCRAHPQASILWHSSADNFVLGKGEHVLEEPQTEYDGYNATSTLIIGYDLDPDWPRRRDTYICSASNKIGTATKKFTIEQGDPPPAFNIGPQRDYNTEKSLFRFTLLGPNFDPVKSNADAMAMAGGSRQVTNQNQAPNLALTGPMGADIVPPVDCFRIRAENPAGGIQMQQVVPSAADSSSSSTATSTSSRHHTGSHSTTQARRRPSQSSQTDSSKAEWSVLEIAGGGCSVAPNQTIDLSRLPSGHQRLYLEAHNAVGWSPNSTYLGDYYIMSAASSVVFAQVTSFWVLLVSAQLVWLIASRPLALDPMIHLA